jgi:hypothetical protein
MPDKKFRGISNLPVAIPDVPDAPTVSASNVGTSRAYNNGAATVTITSPTGGLPTSYSVTTTPTTTTTTATSSPVTLTGLASATSYTVTATPSNVSATGPAGTSSSITATTVPQAPTIGTFTDGGTGTTGTLSFTAGATGGSAITGYKYSTDGTTYSAASGTTSPFSLTGLTVGTYNFSLKATNANGDSLASGNASGTVITPTSYESIATVTATGSESSLTFSSIPGTYSHLQVRAMMRTGLGQTTLDTYMVMNSISSYQYHYLYGDGSSRAAGVGTSSKYLIGRATGSTATSNTFGVSIIDILDYANTNKNKTIRVLNGDDNNGTGNLFLLSGLALSSTAAITSLTFTAESASSFAQYSSFALYGIKG